MKLTLEYEDCTFLDVACLSLYFISTSPYSFVMVLSIINGYNCVI